MRGCTLSSRCLGRLLLCALASRAGAAGLPGTPTLPVPSCPAQVEQGMVAGDDGSGQRPSSLLQMTSPRRTTAPVHEDAEPEAQTPDHNQGLRIVRLLWKNPYATALGGCAGAHSFVMPGFFILARATVRRQHADPPRGSRVEHRFQLLCGGVLCGGLPSQTWQELRFPIRAGEAGPATGLRLQGFAVQLLVSAGISML
ncbi:unnamed protein product [Effrenium voratum]|uniref:Uncharacterized protein n=1 Tax=Effrenium voratum TaxID=2562239 RepID=A0AA36I437_9DINO|nr:unnamed protein product [Effrenium voratum]